LTVKVTLSPADHVTGWPILTSTDLVTGWSNGKILFSAQQRALIRSARVAGDFAPGHISAFFLLGFSLFAYLVWFLSVFFRFI
jgi:hypothetical protein